MALQPCYDKRRHRWQKVVRNGRLRLWCQRCGNLRTELEEDAAAAAAAKEAARA